MLHEHYEYTGAVSADEHVDAYAKYLLCQYEIMNINHSLYSIVVL